MKYQITYNLKLKDKPTEVMIINANNATDKYHACSQLRNYLKNKYSDYEFHTIQGVKEITPDFFDLFNLNHERPK